MAAATRKAHGPFGAPFELRKPISAIFRKRSANLMFPLPPWGRG